jgi:hypothetical protein
MTRLVRSTCECSNCRAQNVSYLWVRGGEKSKGPRASNPHREGRPSSHAGHPALLRKLFSLIH